MWYTQDNEPGAGNGPRAGLRDATACGHADAPGTGCRRAEGCDSSHWMYGLPVG
jgi:hypothetical protein